MRERQRVSSNSPYEPVIGPACRQAGSAEAFAEVRPASTMVQVAALADPAMLVEIEAVAVV